MKIPDARITILVESGNPPDGQAGVTIELRDNDAALTFAKITLTPEQWVSAMSRLGYVKCAIEVYNTGKLGKQMVNKPFEFSLGKGVLWNDREEVAQKKLKEVCPDGWNADGYFRSQDSFFNKDGEAWARTTIRKWISEEGGR